MSAARKAIRQAAAAMLVTAGTAAEDRIHTNRILRWQVSELPGIAVYTRGEAIERFTEAPIEHRRDVELVIEIIVNGESLLDDTLDDIAAEVEAAIWADESIGGTVERLDLSKVEGPTLEQDGATLLGSLQVTFTATYFQGAPLPDVAPPDNFETAQVEYETGSDNDDPEATDTLKPEQEGA